MGKKNKKSKREKGVAPAVQTKYIGTRTIRKFGFFFFFFLSPSRLRR